MTSHIHDVTKSRATPLCGATSGVCVDNDRARCPDCLALWRSPSTDARTALTALITEHSGLTGPRAGRLADKIAAEWLPDLSTEELRAVLVAVDGYEAAAELHKPVRLRPEYRFKPWCGECSTGLVTHSDDGPFKHRVDWPCRTAQALGMSDPLAPDTARAAVDRSEHD